MIGTTIGQYRIESEAGAGGMGVVYRAVDVQLKRPVAIKLLNAAALADPDRKRRFVQEAQAASALNHPDIVTIYQIGTDGTTDFIAMELVAGRSLDDVIAHRPLPVADVLRYATRIAGALAAAHHAGIVHRDLKPANVMVTEKNGIKLLDFGVAKLLEPTTAETAVTGPLAANTRTGLVVGTLAYMSPEQARGEQVDARSDIYAFGVVLHEMITGKRPDGSAAAAPDPTPRDLRRIVARCLQPDPDRRFQVMDDVKLALEEVDLTEPLGERGTSHVALRPWHAALGTVLIAAAAAGMAWWLEPARPARAPILTRLTMDSGLTMDPVLSPDGRFIAFASDRSGEGNLDIWVRQVAGGEPVRLTSDAADDLEPSFSADGSRLAFRSDRDGGGVYVTSTLGGDARRIIDQGRRPRWSPTGDHIVYWTGLSTGYLIMSADAPRVFVVSAAGGEPRRLFADFAIAASPIWSADGTHLLFLGRREMTNGFAGFDWWTAKADGTSRVETGAYPIIAQANLGPPSEGLIPDAWTADGRILFSARLADSTNVWSLPIAPDGRAAEPPVRLTGGTGIEMGATMDREGTLAFAAVSNDIDLWSLSIDPVTGVPASAMQRLTEDPASDFFPWLTDDGRSLAFASNRSGTYDVWVKDLATGKDSLVAPEFTFPSLPKLTKDGTRVMFQSATRGRWVSVPVPGAGVRSNAPQVVCDGCQTFWELSSDRKWAVLGNDGTRIWTRDTASGATTEFLGAPGAIGRLRFSPDDRWVAFHYREAGSIRIHVVPFQPGALVGRDRWIAITAEDTMVFAPIWSTDGGTLYYLSNRDGSSCVWSQRMDRGTGQPAGDAVAVWHFHEARRSMARIPWGPAALPSRATGSWSACRREPGTSGSPNKCHGHHRLVDHLTRRSRERLS